MRRLILGDAPRRQAMKRTAAAADRKSAD